MTDFQQKCDIDIIEWWGNRGGPDFYLFTPGHPVATFISHISVTHFPGPHPSKLPCLIR